ncbi:MAG: glycosyltransferase family 2 protein [Bacilli bacterium]|nr:glycosyltransferase family 2 protein [Bacilli bacterium]
MNKNIKVTFVIPVYNSEKTIDIAINSILNQSYSKIELIVVNDGSTDNTRKVLDKYSKNKNVKIYHKTNHGPSWCRNFAINQASGDFVAFCDGDDYIDTDIVSKFVELEKQNQYKYDVVLFKTNKVIDDTIIDNKKEFESFEFSSEDREILIDSIYNKFLKYNHLVGFDGICGKFISLDLLKENKIEYPENILRFEDAYFCKKVYEKANKIYYLNYLGYYYVKNEDSLCHRYDKNAPKLFLDALLKLGENNYKNNDFYIKTMTTLTECEDKYFLNTNNKKSWNKKISEFKNMLKNDIYYNAIKNINFKSIPLHYKGEVILLRLHFYSLYMFIKKIHLSKNK